MDSFADIKELLKQPYCPVCFYINESLDRQFRWLFIEYRSSAPFIKRLAEGGLCPVHSWQIINGPHGKEMSFAYRAVIKHYGNVLRHLKDNIGKSISEQKGIKRFFSFLFPDKKEDLIKKQKRSCPFCDSRKISGEYIIDRLIKSLDDEENVRLYRKSPGLCRSHLFEALEACDHSKKMVLLGAAIKNIEEISADLDEYFRKTDYRYSHEPKGKEQEAWLKAMLMYDGYMEIGKKFGQC
ncbi:MAG: DUF6062 family protein [Peptococcaceae bacterium]|nr:DUF6062 family protein [Peptococcaceae bacterium]MDH7524916.1 DUF6062 family protein [Peptococcaceae bacterium]